MLKTLLHTLILIFFACSSFVLAQEEEPQTDNQLETKLSSIKNPFKPQLPIKEVIEKPVIKNEPPKDRSTINQQNKTQSPEKTNQKTPPETEKKELEKEKEEVVVPLPDLSVSGIIWNSDRPQAIINNNIVNVGDTFLEIKITDIQKTAIKGEFHGRSVTIKTQRSSL